eukprot:gene5098-139_t
MESSQVHTLKAHKEIAEWWIQYLQPASAVRMSTDYPDTHSQYVTSRDAIGLSRSFREKLLEYNIDSALYFMTALGIVFFRQTHSECFAIAMSSPMRNLVPVRFDLREDMTLSEALKIVHESMDLAISHELHPTVFRQALEQVDAESLQRIFDLCQACFIDVVFRTQPSESIPEHTEFDPLINLCLEFPETSRPEDIARSIPNMLHAEYCSTLYSDERMLAFIEQVVLIAECLVNDSSIKIGECSLITKTSSLVLPNLKKPLNDDYYGAIFYIHEISNRLANFLVAKGITKGDRVAMYAHRSAPLVVGIMGILKSGATFTVVDPAYPTNRQIVYLEVADPKGIVTLAGAGDLDTEMMHLLLNLFLVSASPFQQREVVLEKDTGILSEYSITSCGVEVGPDDIGTLSFTSGSTGKPKAVCGRHISLTHFYPWMAEEFGLGSEDRFSMLSGIAHDPIQRDVFTPIFYGASIYIPDPEDIGNPGALAKWVEHHKVTVAHLTPAMGQLLVANALTVMPSLQHAFFVGDVLIKRDVQRLQRLAPNVNVINMYGTTETQRAVSYLKLRANTMLDTFKDIIPAGKGMKDVQLLVLTKSMDFAAIGELGELYVRSPHLSAGYLGLPEATEAKFLVNSFTNDPADRLYRTGDIGRYMYQGIVECIGRADDQIKIRGFRIELGEIDIHLGEHPSVRENKTLVMRDKNEEKQIISFFVPQEQDTYNITELRQYLSTKVPHYAVPAVFYPLKAMPLTPNGKIDKSKLPFPDTAIMMLNRTQEMVSAEMTDLQNKIKKVFEGSLAGPISLHDSFFEVGGHSILATKVTFELRAVLRQELPINMLYKYPTISKLADAIENQELTGADLPTTSRENQEMIDVEAEAQLDSDIIPSDKQIKSGSINTVLLTGATGFLGSFLLRFLLDENPSIRILCHVRCTSTEAGMLRIIDSLKSYGIHQENDNQRIEILVGDLTKPWIGLSQDAVSDINKRVDLIIHNGAMVHWVYPYSKLKAANVTGTVEVLRIACTGKHLIPMAFVSSTSIFDCDTYLHMAHVEEDKKLVAGEKLTVGYGQSKWVAEKILETARSRSLPVIVFRPGYIVGDSRTGVMNLDDYISRLVKGCCQLNRIPRITTHFNMCNVDFVAKVIVKGSFCTSSIGKCFNFWQPSPFSIEHLSHVLRMYGFELENEEYTLWCEQMKTFVMTQGENALYPLLHYVLDDLPTRSTTPFLAWNNLKQLLRNESSLPDSPPDIAPLFSKYLAFFVSIGFLDAPMINEEGIHQLPEINLPESVKAKHRAETH